MSKIDDYRKLQDQSREMLELFDEVTGRLRVEVKDASAGRCHRLIQVVESMLRESQFRDFFIVRLNEGLIRAHAAALQEAEQFKGETPTVEGLVAYRRAHTHAVPTEHADD